MLLGVTATFSTGSNITPYDPWLSVSWAPKSLQKYFPDRRMGQDTVAAQSLQARCVSASEMTDHCIPSRDAAEHHCPFSSNVVLRPQPALLQLTSLLRAPHGTFLQKQLSQALFLAAKLFSAPACHCSFPHPPRSSPPSLSYQSGATCVLGQC